ncbi:MAG: Hsp20/alpha crystallin family protein [Candidatus Odinarchaeum yellowstonii]|uniref:Hsp20/alpha crystallin family protein n=1 Tax=Odinarchaeota yellowstonii (strain LCB_4) TaxID=1841599 RepID=A0AAF0D1I4_ODILC|nr:MAG: Hsp20/alpha crystallin family protein [Candidatus Odinarchaeum yellowstonii]
MAEDDERRRKKKNWWESDSFDEFEDIDELFKELTEEFFNMPKLGEMIENIIREFEQNKDKFMSLKEPLFWGFSITRGPDNKPVIRKLGNIEPGEDKTIVKEEREPLIDILSEGNEIVVIAELPGVEKDQIKLKAADNYLILNATAPQRKYYKKIDLKEKIDPSSAKAIYKNGVLEVRLKKLDVSNTSGAEIKIQ